MYHPPMGVLHSFTTVKSLDLKPAWAWQGHQLGKRTKLIGLFVFLICVGLGVYKPLQTKDVLLWGFSFFVLFMAAFRIFALLITIKDSHPPQAKDQDTVWPTFTILVPLYKEAHMVKDLVKYLLQTNYPLDLLDIVLVVEQDDLATCCAAKLVSAAPVRVFEVPPSEPRTKPKALNAAFEATPRSRIGDIITVYDAEDRPHPDQLRQAALAFIADPKIAVAQAPLGYFNDEQNLLTALFAVEYAALFHVWNPALARLGIPFTLGGTSNHIRRDILEKCGGWDPHNVTEDADLSFRINALNGRNHRLKIATISPPTQEEAVDNLRGWTCQRSRWLKGFMQTWCVHMRFQKQGPSGENFSLRPRAQNIFSLHITVGATVLAAFMHLPSLILMAFIYWHGAQNILPTGLPLIAIYTGILGYGAAILTGLIGVLRADRPHLAKYVVLMPFYWLLYFWPALIAAYEIVFSPAYWRKTKHVGTPKYTTDKRNLTTENPTLEPSKLPPI